MKPKLRYLYALAAILMLCRCEDNPKTCINNSQTIWVIQSISTDIATKFY